MTPANAKAFAAYLLVAGLVPVCLALSPLQVARADGTDSYQVESRHTNSASSTCGADGCATTTTTTYDASQSSDRGEQFKTSASSTRNPDGTSYSERTTTGTGTQPNATKIPPGGKPPAGGDHWQNDGSTYSVKRSVAHAKDGSSTETIVITKTDKCGNTEVRHIVIVYDTGGKFVSRSESVTDRIDPKPDLPRAFELEFSGSYSFAGHTHTVGSYGSGWIGFKKIGATSYEGQGKVLGGVQLAPLWDDKLCSYGKPSEWIVSYAAVANGLDTIAFTVKPTGSRYIYYTISCETADGPMIVNDQTADLLTQLEFQLPLKDGASYEYPYSGAEYQGLATGSIKFTLRTNFCEN